MSILDGASFRLLPLAAFIALTFTSGSSVDVSREDRLITNACTFAVYHYVPAPSNFDRIGDMVNTCVHSVQHGYSREAERAAEIKSESQGRPKQ
jgi:hypothetical protein